MANESDTAPSVVELEAMAKSLAVLELPTSSTRLLAQRDRAVATIHSYLIPRMTRPDQPLLVVFAGPTGAGKSTLLNSVAGADLTVTGPLRPTTRHPVVFSGRGTAGDYEKIGDVDCETVEGRLPILREMTLVDTPDIDSTEVDHRAMAETLIDNADVVVFVSSALRYADLVPWEVLRRAEARGVPVIHVLNRLRTRSDGALFDYSRLLETEGFDPAVVAVQEHRLPAGAQSIPVGAVRHLRRALVEQVESKQQMRSLTVRRVLVSTCDQAQEIIEAAGALNTEVEIWLDTTAQLFEVGPEDLRFVLAEEDFSGIPITEIRNLAGRSPRQIRRWLRRKGPRPETIAAARAMLLERTIVSIESAMRFTSLGTDTAPIDTVGFEMLRFAVEKWSLGQMNLSRVRRTRRELVHLFSLAASLTDEPWPQELLHVLAPSVNVVWLRSEATNSLLADLEPVIERARSRQTRARIHGVSPSTVVERARSAVSGVIAGSTFAHA